MISQISLTGFLTIMTSTKRASIYATIMLSTLTIALHNAASAQTVPAEQATQLLARSQALDEKCKFLTSSQHDELSAFVAKAEVAMVAKSSVKTAKALIESGRAEGKAAACSETERANAVEIIIAAHQATSRKVQISQAPAPAKSAVVATKVDASKPVIAAVEQPIAVTTPVQTNSGLNQYAQLTEHYYLARRCNSMSVGSINSLYKKVVSTHHNVVASYGVAAVRAVMKQSERQANAARCG